jgi:hypothetical protein
MCVCVCVCLWQFVCMFVAVCVCVCDTRAVSLPASRSAGALAAARPHAVVVSRATACRMHAYTRPAALLVRLSRPCGSASAPWSYPSLPLRSASQPPCSTGTPGTPWCPCPSPRCVWHACRVCACECVTMACVTPGRQRGRCDLARVPPRPSLTRHHAGAASAARPTLLPSYAHRPPSLFPPATPSSLFLPRSRRSCACRCRRGARRAVARPSLPQPPRHGAFQHTHVQLAAGSFVKIAFRTSAAADSCDRQAHAYACVCMCAFGTQAGMVVRRGYDWTDAEDTNGADGEVCI